MSILSTGRAGLDQALNAEGKSAELARQNYNEQKRLEIANKQAKDAAKGQAVGLGTSVATTAVLSQLPDLFTPEVAPLSSTLIPGAEIPAPALDAALTGKSTTTVPLMSELGKAPAEGGGLSSIGNAIADGAGQVGDAIGNVAGQAGDALVSGANAIGDAAVDAGTAIAGGADAAGGAILEGLDAAGTAIGGAATAIGGAVVSGADTALVALLALL